MNSHMIRMLPVELRELMEGETPDEKKSVKKVRVPRTAELKEGKALTLGKEYDVIMTYQNGQLGVILGDDGKGHLIRFAGCAHLSNADNYIQYLTGAKTLHKWEIVLTPTN